MNSSLDLSGIEAHLNKVGFDVDAAFSWMVLEDFWWRRRSEVRAWAAPTFWFLVE